MASVTNGLNLPHPVPLPMGEGRLNGARQRTGRPLSHGEKDRVSGQIPSVRYCYAPSSCATGRPRPSEPEPADQGATALPPAAFTSSLSFSGIG